MFVPLKKNSELTPVWGHPPEHGQFASSDSTTKRGSPYSSSYHVPLFCEHVVSGVILLSIQEFF